MKADNPAGILTGSRPESPTSEQLIAIIIIIIIIIVIIINNTIIFYDQQ